MSIASLLIINNITPDIVLQHNLMLGSVEVISVDKLYHSCMLICTIKPAVHV